MQLFARDGLVRNKKGRVVVSSDLEAGLQLGPFAVDGLELVQLFREVVVVATLAADENCSSICVLRMRVGSDIWKFFIESATNLKSIFELDSRV